MQNFWLWLLFGCSGEKVEALPQDSAQDSAVFEDLDGDGFTIEQGDCNDEDSQIFPYDRSEFGGGIGCGWVVDVGNLFTCALSSAGEVSCWGDNSEGQKDSPEGEYVEISVGKYHACARTRENDVECWGKDMYQQSSVPNEKIVSISAGEFQTCGIKETGESLCWGGYNRGETPPIEGQFSMVSSGAYHNCGVSIEGQIQCWAPPDVDVPTPIPEGTFIEAVATIYLNACGLDTTGATICWGDESDRYTDVPTIGVQSISHGYSPNLCMLMTDSTARCWGEPYWASNVPEDIQFQQLQISDTHLCGVVDSGDIQCWGASSAFPQ